MSKIKTPIEIERWFADVTSIEQLREILKSEVFQQAVAVLKEIAGPSYGNMSSSLEQNNLRFAWYAGYRDAFNDLAKLTKAPSQKPSSISEWGHIDLNT